MARTSLTTYGVIVAYNLLTVVGVVLLGWPVGNILLLGWCENVMFVIAAALANGRLRRESRRTGEPIPTDPSAWRTDDGMRLDATASPFAYLFVSLFFSVVHLVFAGAMAFVVGVRFTVAAFGVPFALAVLRHLTEGFTDSLADPDVRRAKDLRAARDANRRVIVQHLFIMVAWGLGITLMVLNANHLAGWSGSGLGNLEDTRKVAVLGVLVLYVAAKTIVEVRIAWARDHVRPATSLSAARRGASA